MDSPGFAEIYTPRSPATAPFHHLEYLLITLKGRNPFVAPFASLGYSQAGVDQNKKKRPHAYPNTFIHSAERRGADFLDKDRYATCTLSSIMMSSSWVQKKRNVPDFSSAKPPPSSARAWNRPEREDVIISSGIARHEGAARQPQYSGPEQ